MNPHAPQQPNSSDNDRRDGSGRAALSEEVIESIASWLGVIAEPSRIRLIETLNRGGASAQGLAAQLGMTRTNACRHLGVLHRAGIVKRRRIENRVEYELTDWSGWWTIEQVGAAIAAAPECRSARTVSL